jgi:hypothetical protein
MGDEGEDHDQLYDSSRWDISGSSSGPLACESCGSENVHLNERTGDVVCDDCGILSQSQARTLTQEEFGDAGVYRTAGGKARRRDVRKQPSSSSRSGPIPARLAFNAADFLDCIQIIMQQWIHELIERCEAPKELYHIVGDLWFRYIKRWSPPISSSLSSSSSTSSSSSSSSLKIPPIVLMINGHVTTQADAIYVARIRSEGMKPLPVAALSMELLIGILYSGCRWLKLPILAHDLSLWISNGTISYFNTMSALSSDKKLVMRAAYKFFNSVQQPDAQSIERSAIAFVRSLDIINGDSISTLPQPNILPCAIRLIRRANLPTSVSAIVADLLSLYEHDVKNEAAYLRYKVTSKKRVRVDYDNPANELWKLKRLSKDSDGGPGARVAALVAVAMRLHTGWKLWVSSHLQTVAAGDFGAKCARLGAPIYSSTKSSLTCSNVSCHDPEDRLHHHHHHQQQQQHPDVPFPERPETAQLAPEDVLCQYSTHVGSKLLSGGDVGVGRGAVGYPRGDYGSRHPISVKLRDKYLASLLSGREDTRTSSSLSSSSSSAASSSSASSSAFAINSSDDAVDIVEVVDGPRAEYPGYYDLQTRRGPSHSFMVQRGLWPFEQLENVASLSDFLLDHSQSLKRSHERDASRKDLSPKENAITVIPSSVSLVAPVFELQPRLYQQISLTPHQDALYGVKSAPISAKRPLLFLDPHAKALVEMLSEMVDTTIDHVLLRCDALELLIEHYTPLKTRKTRKNTSTFSSK